MKTKLITLLTLLIVNYSGAQNYGDPNNFRPNPTTKHEKLKDVSKLAELSTHLWESMFMPQKDRERINDNRKILLAYGYYAFPQSGYEAVVEIVKVTIAVKSNGVIQSAESTSDKISAEQKELLKNADVGSDIGINIAFKHKAPYGKGPSKEEVTTGWTTITAVPNTEAEFPGGYLEAATFISKNYIQQLGLKQPALIVTFLVNEKGKAVAPQVSGLDANSKTQQALLEFISKMPMWKPAKDSFGKNISQEFNFQYGGGGC